MNNKRDSLKGKELEEAVLTEKLMGTPDVEIGRKYGVTFKYIEKIITKVHGLNISAINIQKKIKSYQPKDFKEERTTVWSFKQRGNWATHSGEYRGNWSPYIPRNVILKYSKPGEVVLDYFCGAGTTAVESKLLGRRCIAIDINENAIELAKKNLDFEIEPQRSLFDEENKIAPNLSGYEPQLIIGDARDLSFIDNDSIDLICAHPPYANIIHYTDSKVGDLSLLNMEEFLKEMFIVAKESYRVLKPGKKCAILIGDTRSKKHVIPLGFKLIDVFLKAGFLLKELVIKRQHNCKTTGFWYENSIKYNFLLLAHEYLPIFEKPKIEGAHILKEAKENYNSIFTVKEDIKLKRKLDKLETTTVWIFPDNEFEKLLDRNVIERYSNKKNYLVISLYSENKSEVSSSTKKSNNKNELLFIKSPIISFNSSLDVEYYINRIKNIVKEELQYLHSGGFLVIQAHDIRINGYIEPLAKRVVEEICDDKLWLKEIIIVIKENELDNTESTSDELLIKHQYLIVYEKTKDN
ncbi:MAG: DNA methyltransferase [Melioribacteraceae bacterium]